MEVDCRSGGLRWTAGADVDADVDADAGASTNAGGNARYVGLFNTAAAAQTVGVSFAALGLGEGTSKCTVTDMWAGKELELEDTQFDSSDFNDEKGVSATVPKHGAVLLHLTDCQ